jgi:hypothetical protein
VPQPSKVFLLSPANCSGKRAGYLLRPQAKFDLALRLRSSEGAPVGEIFSFMSGLYFRGKLAYARAFASAPAGCGGVHVIVPGHGLMPPDQRVTLKGLKAIAKVPVDVEERRYMVPLKAAAADLCDRLGDDDLVVLLGSLATFKYLKPLGDTFGGSLRFPAEFVGLGDMSRGSLMLKSARAGRELDYIGLPSGRTKGVAA